MHIGPAISCHAKKGIADRFRMTAGLSRLPPFQVIRGNPHSKKFE